MASLKMASLGAVLFLAAILAVKAASSRPNIIFLLLDDAGRADFERFDDHMRTPAINKLTEDGMYLDQSYVLPMCAPTRAALMTGRYPHTFGVQEGQAIGGNKMFWVNENFSMVADAMKDCGYKTHMLGKWHQGYCHPELTPLGRGFDTYYGFWFGSHTDYYNHTKGKKNTFDFWDGDRIAEETRGKYQTDILNERAVKIVQDSSADEPFFMYLAYGAPHGPFQCPERYITDYCSHVTNRTRQVHCGMMAAVDEGVRDIVAALKAKGTYDNTVILLMSDNGGPVKNTGSVNFPLRGAKQTVYEGGTRVFTVFKAPGLAATNTQYDGMVHAIDWLPTFVDIAGGKIPEWSHGMSVWDALRTNSASPRTKFIYTVNDLPAIQHSAFRIGDYKIIKGKGGPTEKSGWYPDYRALEREDKPEAWGLNGMKVRKDFEIYNVVKDPNEKKNLYLRLKRKGKRYEKLNKKNPKRAAKVFGGDSEVTLLQDLKDKAAEFLVEYPLQPIYLAPASTLPNTKDGYVATCWCDPAGYKGRADVLTCPWPKA